MQNMIKEIVDMDRRAREITEAAQQEKINSEKEVAEKREQIREEYLTKARERIALNEPKEREAAEEAWRAVEARQNEISRIPEQSGCFCWYGQQGRRPICNDGERY